MLTCAVDEMPFIWIFQQDNNPKHTSKKAKKFFANNIIDILECPSQSADLNPIDNLWTDFKKAVHTCNSTSNEALWMVVKKSWKRMPITNCQDLVATKY